MGAVLFSVSLLLCLLLTLRCFGPFGPVGVKDHVVYDVLLLLCLGMILRRQLLELHNHLTAF